MFGAMTEFNADASERNHARREHLYSSNETLELEVQCSCCVKLESADNGAALEVSQMCQSSEMMLIKHDFSITGRVSPCMIRPQRASQKFMTFV